MAQSHANEIVAFIQQHFPPLVGMVAALLDHDDQTPMVLVHADVPLQNAICLAVGSHFGSPPRIVADLYATIVAEFPPADFARCLLPALPDDQERVQARLATSSVEGVTIGMEATRAIYMAESTGAEQEVDPDTFLAKLDAIVWRCAMYLSWAIEMEDRQVRRMVGDGAMLIGKIHGEMREILLGSVDENW